MADEPIDSLDIELSLQATKATKAIDSFIAKLDSLENSMKKVNGSALGGLSKSIGNFTSTMLGVKQIDSRSFTTLARNIEKLSAVNTAGLNNASSAMNMIAKSISGIGAVSQSTQSIVELANSISRLGSKSVTNATTNLPLLSKALNELLTTLSKATTVNRNIIDMTNALANLASQGSKVGTATRSISSGLNTYARSARVANRSTASLAGMFGKFYASMFLVIRGTKKLKESIEKSMDYIETLNYFDAAFEQVANNANLSAFENLGYASADAYAYSFAKRAKALTRKMTGFEINDDGTLASTGQTSLGMNPQQIMNYQAMFGQMSSSMGVASETALTMSEALTKIGADLASVKNMDFEDVWNNLAAALGGASRAVDKFGINIRNVNLQQKLLELGIDENIQNLNQQDKALLRGIIILESTQYAWGDLSETLNAPANQVRLLESNLENLSRTIGNLFLPAVQKILPYVNGFTVAVQRLVEQIGALMGVDFSKIQSTVQTPNNENVADQLDDIDQKAEEAEKEVKKLKQQLSGFDELNLLSSNQNKEDEELKDGLTGGLLDEEFQKAFKDYNKVWEDAYANSENRISEIADKFVEKFSPVLTFVEKFEPIIKSIGGILEKLKPFWDGFIDGLGEMAGLALDGVNIVLEGLNDVLGELDGEDLEKIGNGLGILAGGLVAISAINSLSKVTGAIGTLGGILKANPILSTFVLSAGVLKFLELIDDSDKEYAAPFIDGFVDGLTDLAKITLDGITVGLELLTGTIGELDSAELKVIGEGFGHLAAGLIILKGVTGISKMATDISSLAKAFASSEIGKTLIGLASSNPILTGMVLTASIGTSILFYMDKVETEKARQQYQELVDGVLGEGFYEKIAEEKKNITEVIESLKNFDESKILNAGTSETSYAQSLVDRFIALKEEVSLTNGELTELDSLRVLLEDELPGFSEIINNETISWENQKKAIENLIEQQRTLYRLKAAKSNSEELYAKLLDEEMALQDAQKTFEDLLKKRNSYLIDKESLEMAMKFTDVLGFSKTMDELYKEWGIDNLEDFEYHIAIGGFEYDESAYDAYKKTLEQIDIIDKGIEEQKSVISLYEQAIEELGKKIEWLEDVIVDAQTKSTELTKKNEELTKSSEGMTDPATKSIDETKKSADELNTKLTSTLNLFNKMAGIDLSNIENLNYTEPSLSVFDYASNIFNRKPFVGNTPTEDGEIVKKYEKLVNDVISSKNEPQKVETNVEVTIQQNDKGVFNSVKKQWTTEVNRTGKNPVPVIAY